MESAKKATETQIVINPTFYALFSGCYLQPTGPLVVARTAQQGLLPTIFQA